MKFLNASLIAMLLLVCSIHANGQANISVDHYSGRGNVIVPIATVNDRGLSHFIGLSYSADATKVDDIPGWLSTNWTLVAGGEVKRKLKGLPDDYTSSNINDLRRGWLFNNNADNIGDFAYPIDGSGPASCNPATLYDFINAFNHNVDPEPDEFHFNAGGISGTFVFDNTGSITAVKTIPYQDIQINAIRATATSPISSFEILAPNGVKYIFSTQETTEKKADDAISHDLLHFRKEYYWYHTPLYFTSSWKLTRIESHLGEHIDFSYFQKEKISTTPVVVGVNYNSSTRPEMYSHPADINQYTIVETTQSKIISEVNTASQKVTFSSSSSQVLPDGTLNSIVVNDVSAGVVTWLKKFILQHVGYQSADTEDLNYRRFFLKGISIETPCDFEIAYSFVYNQITSIPSPTSTSQDIWGYPLDGVSNYHLFPKLYVYPGQTGLNRISLFQQPGVTNEIVIPGASRISSGTKIYGSLAKIIYSSGGEDSLEYESHSFHNPITNTATLGGGLRIKKIITTDNVTNQSLTRSFQYVNTSGTTSGKLVALPVFWMINGFYKEPTLAGQDPANTPTSSFTQLSSLPDSIKWHRLILRTKANIHPDMEAVDVSIAYERVTETLSTGNGKTVYDFQIPYILGSGADANWNPTYINIAASSSCPNIGFNQSGFYNPNFVQQTPVNFRRGLLTKVGIFKENDNTPLKEVIYNYQDKAISQADVIGLDYEFIPVTQSTYYFLLGAYKLKTNVTRILTSKLERTKDETNPTTYIENVTNYNYDGATHNFVTSTSTTNSNGSQVISRIKYVKDYGSPDALTSDHQVNMIDALNLGGRGGEIVEQANSIVPLGASEKTISASLTLFDNFGTSVPRILPKQILQVDVDNGITGFTNSSITGSGASRTFSKSAAYRTTGNLKFNTKGDVIRQENNKRQVQSFHYDNATGTPIASILNTEPDEVVYSNFDQDTDFDFEVYGFSASDKSAIGKNTSVGLGGVINDPSKYLKKQFKKKANTKYVFSSWYKPSVTTGTHSLSIVIKDLSNVQLQQHTLDFSVSSGVQWHYGEKTIDLSGISATDLIIEVKFSGSVGLTSMIDELLFSPLGTEISRSTYKFPFGQISTTDIDGRMTQYERDKNGRLRLVRDHENFIIKKIDYNRKDEQTTNFKIVGPYEIKVNELATFRGLNGCKDIETIEWKVSLASDPNGGTYAIGTTEFQYTFQTHGDYNVKARFYHPSYGAIEMNQLVRVLLEPLTVAICQEGPSNVNLCSEYAINIHQCTGEPTGQGNSSETRFTATPSGCASGTYTYRWYRRKQGEALWLLSFLNGSAYTQTAIVNNDVPYEVKCVVTSSCGAGGETATKSVNVYSYCGSLPQKK